VTIGLAICMSVCITIRVTIGITICIGTIAVDVGPGSGNFGVVGFLEIASVLFVN
jgi:hypothetical protein